MVLEASINITTTVDYAAAAAVGSGNFTSASPHGESGLEARKLKMLRRTGLFGDDLKGAIIERACTADDLRQAYRLVHDVYLGTGFIASDPSGMRVRIFETSAETATFVAKVEGKVVAVLSVVEDSPDLGLPSDCVFKPELDAMRRAGRRLCEVTNQAVAEEYRKSGVPTELMRCAIAVSLTEGYDEAIAAVSPSHNGFYDLMGFRQVGSQRSYSTTIDDPVIAVSMNIDQYREPEAEAETSATGRFMRQFLTEGNVFLSRVTDWALEARKQFLTPSLLKCLFVLEKNFLADCSSEELEILYRRWGHETFVKVTADMLASVGVRFEHEPELRRTSGPLQSASRNASTSRRSAPRYARSHYGARRASGLERAETAVSGSELAPVYG